MDLSFDLAPSDRNLKHPTSRQNFVDAPGQTPKLILTLCLSIPIDLTVDSAFNPNTVFVFSILYIFRTKEGEKGRAAGKMRPCDPTLVFLFVFGKVSVLSRHLI